MKRTHRIRWTVVPLALMSLANVPAAFTSTSGEDGPKGSAWPATIVGIAGLVAVVSLVRRLSWGRPLAVAIGALNVAGGVWALAAGYGNGVVGVVLGGLITAFGLSLTVEPIDSMPAARP